MFLSVLLHLNIFLPDLQRVINSTSLRSTEGRMQKYRTPTGGAVVKVHLDCDCSDKVYFLLLQRDNVRFILIQTHHH